MAGMYLTPGEFAIYENLKSENKAREFCTFRTWKEALLKARRTGISLPLDRVDTLDANKNVLFLSDSAWNDLAGWKTGAVQGWSIVSLSAGKEYVAVLALEGQPLRMTIYSELTNSLFSFL
jgi:hypothetical protein